MYKLIIITSIFYSQFGFSQTKSVKILLDSGKAEFKRQAAEQVPNYSKALDLLTDAVKLKPDNAEAHYFLGYTIDRQNSADGETMYASKKELTLRASEQFENVNWLEEKYTGEIILLDPYSKLTSIWGSLAQAYWIKNLADSANWAFKEGKKRGGFIEPVLEFNRQLLNSCKQNSIIVTYGDNITIPSWYLQAIEHYRTDVTIVDANLINSTWYPKHLKSNNLKMTFSDSEIDTINYISWIPKDITIKDPNDTTQTFTWTLKPTYYNQYILRGDRILLDIVKENLYKRDVYFSESPDSTYNLFLTDYLIDDGIVSHVILQKNDLTTQTAIVSKNLHSYNILKVPEKEIKKSRDAVIVLNGFRWTFYGNSNFLYSKGQVGNAKSLLNEMEERFPINKLPYDSKELEDSIKTLKGLMQ